MSIIVKTIPEGWNIITLENTEIEIIDGDRGKNYPKKSELLKQGYCPFFNNKNIIGDKISLEEVDFISEDKDRQLRKGKAFLDDIIITTRGSVGNVGILHEGLGITFARINSGMVILRNKDSNINTWYLYYLLKSPLVKEQYRILSSGSAQPQLPIRDLKKIELVIPPYDLQVKVASILDSYERKIELNNQMNQTLEEMAMTLYKHWFVDFGPFQDGEFVESELGMIPKGWTVGSIGDISNISSGKRPPKVLEDALYPIYGGGGIKAYTDNYLFDEKIIVTGRVGTIGKIFRLKEKVWPSDNALVLTGKEDYFYNFIYIFLSKFDFSPITGGSTQPLITQTSVKNIKTIIPPKEVMQSFNIYVDKWFENIDLNLSENGYLQETRDYLLPKLLSGEIDLSKTEKEVEKVL